MLYDKDCFCDISATHKPRNGIDVVVRIVCTGDLGREILITKRALQDWEATTMSWPHDLLDSIKQALNQKGVTGNLETGLEDRGETYEFWIFHGGKQLYCKVCLLEAKLKIKVISAHRPLKGTKSL